MCVGCAALAVFFSKLNLGISFVGLLIAVAVYTVPVCVAATRDSYDWLKRKDQGSKTTATCASPEFINACLQTLFPIIDKSVFNHFIDLFEQNFQLLKPPPLIESIKIADFDLGIHAPRIQHLKLVPQGQQRSADENQTAILFDAEIEMQPTTAEGGMFFVVIAGIGERQMGIVPISIRVSSVGFRIRARIHCTLTPHFPFTHMARISLLEVTGRRGSKLS